MPVLGHDNATLAAVNVAMHAERGAARERIAEILPELRSAADALQRDLVAVGAFHRLNHDVMCYSVPPRGRPPRKESTNCWLVARVAGLPAIRSRPPART